MSPCAENYLMGRIPSAYFPQLLPRPYRTRLALGIHTGRIAGLALAQ